MSSDKKRITVKIDNSFVIWFGESNSWIQLEEPAYFIYKLFSRRADSNLIYKKCQKKYDLTETDVHHFVDEIIEGFKKLSVPHTGPEQSCQYNKDITNYIFQPELVHSYLINGKKINLQFENPLIGYYVHPLFSHLEIPLTHKPHAGFELFTSGRNYILRYVEKPDLIWSYEDIGKLKRKLFIEISNTIYNKKADSWMSFIHASAVSDGNQTILLSSDSGSGKSTLAAFLIKQGMQFVSDDFLPLSAKNKLAYPFPAAISLKKASYSLFPDKQLTELEYHGLKNSSVKYLIPEIMNKTWYDPGTVNKILFVRFDKTASSEIKKLPVLKALNLFLDQADVSSSTANARKFIKWFIGTECYQLVYSDTPWAVKNIHELLKS